MSFSANRNSKVCISFRTLHGLVLVPSPTPWLMMNPDLRLLCIVHVCFWEGVAAFADVEDQLCWRVLGTDEDSVSNLLYYGAAACHDIDMGGKVRLDIKADDDTGPGWLLGILRGIFYGLFYR